MVAEQDQVIWVSGLPRRASWNMQCQALLLKLEKVLANCDCVYKYIFVYVCTYMYLYNHWIQSTSKKIVPVEISQFSLWVLWVSIFSMGINLKLSSFPR